MDVLEKQYEWIRRTRELLFRYCESMPPKDYTKEVAELSGGSIRDLHAHVAGCYRHWLGNVALNRGLKRIDEDALVNVSATFPSQCR